MAHRGMVVGLFTAVMLLAGAAVPLRAQSIEAIMRARERLALTEQQIQQLDQVRREAVAQRSAEQAQIAELRSQLEAGQIRRSQLMAAQEEQQDARQARAEQRRASIDAILTDDQRQSLDQVRRRRGPARPGIRRPGVGTRIQPGFAPRAPRRPQRAL